MNTNTRDDTKCIVSKIIAIFNESISNEALGCDCRLCITDDGAVRFVEPTEFSLASCFKDLLTMVYAIMQLDSSYSAFVYKSILEDIIAPNFSAKLLVSTLKDIYFHPTSLPSFTISFLELFNTTWGSLLPLNYFHFPSEHKPEIVVPTADGWPCQSGWALNFWIKLHKLQDGSCPKICLYSLQSKTNSGLSTYFLDKTFSIFMFHPNQPPNLYKVNFQFEFNQV